MISVVLAFLDSGFLNAGTPFDTASTPVSATAPDANACLHLEQVSCLARVFDRWEVLHEDSKEPDDDECEERSDVEIRGWREERT
jgi:hypothetical protein